MKTPLGLTRQQRHALINKVATQYGIDLYLAEQKVDACEVREAQRLAHEFNWRQAERHVQDVTWRP